jgi:hypothetical protein
LLIGAGHVNSSASYWKGKIDDVRIYRTALGETELAEVNDWLGDADGDGLGNGPDGSGEQTRTARTRMATGWAITRRH